METLTYRTLDGPLATLSPEQADALSARIRGGVITAADADYEAARRLRNGMVDRHPALIARCLGSQDVRHAIDFARDHRMPVSVRGGGHHIAGNAVAEGGLVIDLSALRGVRVDPQDRTARVGAGARNYWKSQNFHEITDELIDTVIRGAEALPGPECEIFIPQLDGALGEVAVTDTAYAGRNANFVMNIHGRWQDTADDDRMREWARGVFHDTTPFATGGGYVNFLTEDEDARVDSAYGQNYTRLQELKRQYDTDNLFRINQNIVPAMLARTA